jgi:hypothetical protein
LFSEGFVLHHISLFFPPIDNGSEPLRLTSVTKGEGNEITGDTNGRMAGQARSSYNAHAKNSNPFKCTNKLGCDSVQMISDIPEERSALSSGSRNRQASNQGSVWVLLVPCMAE